MCTHAADICINAAKHAAYDTVAAAAAAAAAADGGAAAGVAGVAGGGDAAAASASAPVPVFILFLLPRVTMPLPSGSPAVPSSCSKAWHCCNQLA